MPLLDFCIDSIAAAALVYLAIGLTLHLSSKFVMPKHQASPGQLELDFAAVEPADRSSTAANTPRTNTPRTTVATAKTALSTSAAETEPPAVVPNWADRTASLGLCPTSAELRKACQQRGIKWRNSRLDGKHLRKAEMVAALVAA